ncbi:MAG: class I SAM-dependent methyltransferase [Bdellovibrionaceae bacterium]|nr:class I SAM-dependent methyltransferase [Pseudobdellovibrionaceae bacterium]
MQADTSKAKKNVEQFNLDVSNDGSYSYTTTESLSGRFSNGRLSDSIASAFEYRDQRVLDLGCGDGAYTVEFGAYQPKEVLGVDPAELAVAAAKKRAVNVGVDRVVKFRVGNIYDLDQVLNLNDYDCIVIRGVLHHLPDPKKAIQLLKGFKGTVVILEPNGNNPVLKLIERLSRYHVDHEERSFFPMTINWWLEDAGFDLRNTRYVNLVPFFCPNWMARLLRVFEPLVERIPLVRNFVCGQVMITAKAHSSRRR